MFILLTAVTLSSTYAAEFCSSEPQAAPEQSSTAETKALAIIAEIQEHLNRYELNRTVPSLDVFKGYKTRIETLIRNNVAQEKSYALRPIYSFYRLLAIASDSILRADPNILKSLNGITGAYSIEFDKDDVMWIFPTRDSLASLELTDVGNNRVRVAFSEADTLESLIKAQSYASRPVETNYYETAKCLFSAAVTAKYAHTVALQGKLNASIQKGKACGNITFAQLFNTFMNADTRAIRDYNARVALLNSTPNFTNLLDKNTIDILTQNGLYENYDFLTIYLGGIPASGRNQPGDREYITGIVKPLISKVLSAYQVDANLTSFFSAPEFKTKLEQLLNECGSIGLSENFTKELGIAEEVFFIQGFEQAVSSTPTDLSKLTPANLDKYMTELLIRVKINSMGEALLTTLTLEGMTMEEAQDASKKYIAQVLLSGVPTHVLSVKGAVQVFTARVKSAFETQFDAQQPLKDMRTSFDTSMIKAAADIEDFMKKDLKDLPYKKSILNEVLGAEINSLQPQTRSLIDVALKRGDASKPGYFTKSTAAWTQALKYVTDDTKAAQARGAKIPEKPKFTAVKNVGDVVSNARTAGTVVGRFFANLFGAMAAPIVNPVVDTIAPQVKKNNEQKAKDIHQLQDLETVKMIGNIYGYSNRTLNGQAADTEPKFLSEVLPAYSKGRTEKEMKKFDKDYRAALRKATYAEFRMLEMKYSGKALYEAVARGKTNASAAEDAISYGLDKTVKNQLQHLNDFASAKKLKDLDSFILHTNFLGTLLGDDDDMAVFVAKNDFWPSTRAIAEKANVSTFIAPYLVQFHNEYRNSLLRKDAIKAAQWDDFYDNLSAVALPLIGLYGAQYAVRWFTNLVRIPLVPSVLATATSRVALFTNGYWNIFFWAMVADTGIQSQRWIETEFEKGTLNRLAFTDTVKDKNLAFYVPILDEATYTSQFEAAKQRIRNYQGGITNNVVAIALPYAGVFAFGKLFQNRAINSYRTRQLKINKLASEGNRNAGVRLEKDYTNRYKKYFANKARENELKFMTLGVPKGTWDVSVLRSGLSRVAPAKKAAAQEAYNHLLRVINTKYMSAQTQPLFRRALIKAIWKSESDAATFATELNRTNPPVKGGRK